MKKILVLTYWAYNGPLIQSYTLPYLRVIAKYNSIEKISLVTLEPLPVKTGQY